MFAYQIYPLYNIHKGGDSMTMILPEAIQTALSLLHNAGFEANLVGGCVRDYLLGREIHDYDITTSALPEETKKVFQDYKVIETGIKHGTITVVINHQHLEITTYRHEEDYEDHRHPNVVYFTRSLNEDLVRRDFTINALVYSNEKGVVDLFNGIDDINNKVIRIIGNDEQRFDEDALRILRGLRFSSQLGFSIEPSTFLAMILKKELLHTISRERITEEFLKYLGGDYLETTREYADSILPVIFDDYPENTQELFDQLVQTKTLYIRLALWASYMKFPNLLVLPNKLVETVKVLTQHFHTIPQTLYEVKCLLRDLKEEDFHLLLDYYETFHNEQYLQITKLYKEVQINNCCYSIKNLAISGSDLIQLGYQGKEISETLSKLLDLVMNNELENTKEVLLEHLKQ